MFSSDYEVFSSESTLQKLNMNVSWFQTINEENNRCRLSNSAQYVYIEKAFGTSNHKVQAINTLPCVLYLLRTLKIQVY